MEQLVLVEHHFLTRFTNHIVERGEFDRIDRACLFAHATEDAPQLVDLKLGGVFFAIIPWGFCCFDMNAVGGANSGAHHAGDTFDASCRVSVESMHASEV